MTKILIIDQMHPSIIPLLKDIGTVPDYRPDIQAPEVEALIDQYDGLILRSKMRITDRFIGQTQRLRFIARAGAGVDEIDEAVLQDKGITLLNAPEGNRDAVGEHAIGMLLCLLNKLHTADRQVRDGQWLREANRGYELGRLTVGIIGYGNMGQAFAKRLSGFGCKVLAYDKYRTQYADQYAEEAQLADLFAHADVLSLHIPLNAENKSMVDTSFIQQFQKPFFLINTARGEVVPFDAVVQGLAAGKLRGAALDVLENEKLPTLEGQQLAYFKTLAASDKVLFSPHVGGWTYESYARINQVLSEKIARLLPYIH